MNNSISRRDLSAFLAGGLLSAHSLHAQSINGVPRQSILPGNTYYVGANCQFTTIAQAVSAINAGTAPTSSSRSVIYVYPGLYVTTSAIVVPQYVSIVGVGDPNAVRLQNNTTDLFTLSGFHTFVNLTVVQGTAASTWAFNCGNNTDIGLLSCNMYGAAGAAMGLMYANGAAWARISIQHCLVDSYLTSGYICSFIDTNTSVRFCDAWIKDCFFDAYQLTNFGGAIWTEGVQDFRIEYSTLRGANTWNTSIRLAKGAITSGTPQVEIRHCYTTGAVSVFNESGTNLNILNSDCSGTAIGGTSTQHNSYTGAAYNALGPI